MEGFLAAVRFLMEHPVIAVLVELVTLALVLWVWKDARAARAAIDAEVRVLGKEIAYLRGREACDKK